MIASCSKGAEDWTMVSIVEAALASIVRRLNEARERILMGFDLDREMDDALRDILTAMEELDEDVRLLIDSYW
jgi:hypothetical protein